MQVFDHESLAPILANIDSIKSLKRITDLRMVLQNCTGRDLKFYHPSDHDSAVQTIPATGDKTAVTILFNGTPREQFAHAQQLNERYHLLENGITPKFLSDFMSGELTHSIKTIYAPTSFTEQTKQFTARSCTVGKNGAYGMPHPTQDRVLILSVPSGIDASFKGTHTSAVNFTRHPETGDKRLAVVIKTNDRGEILTYPLAFDMAKEFYPDLHQAEVFVPLKVSPCPRM